MNWYKYLDKAWKDFYKKKINKGEEVKPYIYYAKNIKQKIKNIDQDLRRKNYNFGKWKVVPIPKKDGRNRHIVIPNSIRDKLVLKAISEYLSDSLSYLLNHVNSISYAYQKGKSTRDALIQLKKVHKPENILLKIDIKHFFDEIDKTILIQLLNQYSIDDYVKDLISKSINPTIDYSALKKRDIDKFPQGGIPQGNPISNILSNLYLYELDRLAISKAWKMIRYADDMVISVSNIEEAHLILEEIANYLLADRKLTIHPLGKSYDAKTTIISNPKKNRMRYLGIDFDGQNLFPTKECRSQLIEKIKTILKRTATPKEKEDAIKTTIAQWCGYYAFTDIPNSQIKYMNNIINHQISRHNFNIRKVNMIEVFSKTRKRQNNRFLKLLTPIRFGEEYRWLNVYY